MDRLIDFLGLVMIYLLGAWSGIVTIALVQAARRAEDFDEEELETRSRDSESEE